MPLMPSAGPATVHLLVLLDRTTVTVGLLQASGSRGGVLLINISTLLGMLENIRDIEH